ncbi:unnamed protein product [Durusdinium trenchii]|uniref:RCC1-like domain-containing protein n=1 Tax=Durusdinium trenchii TaxID=1381693 RepID=A0ABP0RYH8_9DINO
MEGLHRFCRVAAGGAHSLLVTERAEVLAWGSNSHGQVGNDSLEDIPFPVTVIEPGRAQFVFAGRYSSMMIDLDGQLWAWGSNEDGILGIGSGVAKQVVPTRVETGGKAIKHAAGGWKHFLAVTEDGELLTWGNNDYGQLGDGTQEKRRAAMVTPLPGNVRAEVVSAGSYQSLVLTETGEVLAAGMGYTKPGLEFLQVIRTGVTMVVAGISHNLALTRTGTVLAWGANDHGQIGNGSFDFQPTPTAVARKQLIIAAGGSQSYCADDVYQVKAWGYGVMPADPMSLDCPDRFTVTEPTDLFIPDGAFSIAAGDDHAVIVGPLGQVGAYGANMCGQVGNNSLMDVGRIHAILQGGTVEILSREARLAAAIKGPAEEYMLESKASAESEPTASAVQLALGPRAAGGVTGPVGDGAGYTSRSDARQILSCGVRDLLAVQRVPVVAWPEGLRNVPPPRNKVYHMTEKRHVRQVESKTEFQDRPNGKRVVYRTNGLRASDQPAKEVDITTEMTRKARVEGMMLQRNLIDCHALGDKYYRHPEYAPGFYKAGGLITGSSFHRGMHKKTQPRNGMSVVLLTEGTRRASKTYLEMLAEREATDAKSEVQALTNEWENQTLKEIDKTYQEPLDSEDEGAKEATSAS